MSDIDIQRMAVNPVPADEVRQVDSPCATPPLTPYIACRARQRDRERRDRMKEPMRDRIGGLLMWAFLALALATVLVAGVWKAGEVQRAGGYFGADTIWHRWP